MTEAPTTVTQELEAALAKLEKLQHKLNAYLFGFGYVTDAKAHIENAMTKIQVLRCSAVAELDKL